MAASGAVTSGGYSSDFIRRLDLGDNPFSANYQSDYFYSGAKRQHTLEQLIHFCRFSNQLVVLLGESGSGKTVIIDEAVAELHSVIDCCRVTALLLATPESILVELAKQLRFAIDEPITVERFLASLTVGGQVDGRIEPVIVIVESAHDLDQDSVELLLKLQTQSRGALHLVLTGDFALKDIVDMAGIEEGALKHFDLQPLSQSEVAEYVQGCLESVGYAGEQPLSPDQLSVLHEQSKGNLAAINELVPRLLSVDSQPVTSGLLSFKIPKAHIAAIVVLLGALTLSYLYEGSPEAALPPAVEIDKPEPSVVAAQDEPSQPLSGSIQRSEPEPAPAERQASVAEPASKPLPETPKPEAGPKTESAAEPKPQPKVVATKPKAAPVPSKPPAAPVVASPPPAAPVKVATAPPAPKPVVSPAQTTTESTAERTIPAREQRLLSFSPNQYMLQVLGARSEKSARGFVKDYVGVISITYFETTLSGKPWFVVVVGPYDSKKLASDSIAQLPPSLKKQKPWAKSLSSIQDQIRQNRSL